MTTEMTRDEAIELLEKEKVYMIGHGGDRQAKALDMAIRAVNEENFKDACIKQLSKKQESVLDKDCEHCSKTRGTLGCCDMVSNKWVYSCKEGQREYLLNKIKAEIEQTEINGHIRDVECFRAGINVALNVINKYKAGEEYEDN